MLREIKTSGDFLMPGQVSIPIDIKMLREICGQG
jgi:hypothetical protein